MLNIVSTGTKSCRARTQLRRAISDKCGEQASEKNIFLPKKNRGKFFINLHEDKLNRKLRIPKDEKQTMSLIFIYLSQMKICTLIISALEWLPILALFQKRTVPWIAIFIDAVSQKRKRKGGEQYRLLVIFFFRCRKRSKEIQQRDLHVNCRLIVCKMLWATNLMLDFAMVRGGG